MPAAEPALKIGIHGSLLALSQAYGVRRNLMAAFDLPLEAFEGGVIKVTSEVMHDR
ncbi:MAG: hydroxymethylbilane synthase, partial [Cypionkella sp.]|nr:hydroxymethylbilane synthase [Cypionkella sp.]